MKYPAYPAYAVYPPACLCKALQVELAAPYWMHMRYQHGLTDFAATEERTKPFIVSFFKQCMILVMFHTHHCTQTVILFPFEFEVRHMLYSLQALRTS